MFEGLLLSLVQLPFLPVTLFLAARDLIYTPAGVSLTMRVVLLNMRLRFAKHIRHLSAMQPLVNRINAKYSTEYCNAIPKPPKSVRAREIKLAAPAWSSTLAASPHAWKWFLIEPVRAFPSKRPFILYSHGGSFVKTIDPLHFKFLYEICERTGAVILMHDYPRPPASASHEETYDVLTELIETLVAKPDTLNASSLAADEEHVLKAFQSRTKLVFMGDSAGGTISLALCLELLNRGLNDGLPEEAILISPALDGRLLDAEVHDWKDPWLSIRPCHTVCAAWAGPNRPITHYLISPALASEDLLRALLRSKTRITNFKGTADILLPGSLLFHERIEKVVSDGLGEKQGGGAFFLDERVRFVKGVGMPHVWPLIPIPTPEVRDARRAIVATINSD
ncbi:hypothetical protein OC844_003112 [Tilletia horrida]|nr:hypothetical protein OC844_003112 [Tilletia horrida]